MPRQTAKAKLMKTQQPHAIGKLRPGSFLPLVFSVIVAMASAVDGANYTVSTTNDAGEGSFRQAILDANASEGADQITFNLAGDGPHTFFPFPPLPALTDSVLIDGYSQRFASPNTLTNGNNASLQVRLLIAGPGIRIAASNCTIRGLAVIRGGESAFGNAIEISGTGNAIEGCFVGVDLDGKTVGLPGGGYGIFIAPSAISNTIGGAAPEARNLISGNLNGVRLDGSRNAVLGNYIGTDRNGTDATPNQGAGIDLRGSSNIIGGELPMAGNLISGNYVGIGDSFPSHATLIVGNSIGTDVTSRRRIPNRSAGIWLSLAQHTTIGRLTAGSGNVISGNLEDGIVFNSALAFTNLVQGNFIGTDRSGTLDLGNGRNGLSLITWYHQVGGIVPAAANVIAYNRGLGISAPSGPNLISGNSIFANGLGGIQSYFPSNSFLGLNSAAIASNGWVVRGTVNASPSAPYRIEIFTSPKCVPSGRREGKTFSAWVDVFTDRNGHADWVATLPFSISGEQVLTATATHANQNTSEFSPCFELPLPHLTIVTTNTNVIVLRWPSSQPEFTLQTREALSPATAWQAVGDGITSNESGWLLRQTNGLSSGSRFYRLSYP